MEGLLQRQMDPKGLQEMVHVSCLSEARDGYLSQQAGLRPILCVGNRGMSFGNLI